MNRCIIVFFMLFAFIVFANKASAQSKILTEAPPVAGGFSATRLARLDSGMNDWVKQKWGERLGRADSPPWQNCFL